MKIWRSNPLSPAPRLFSSARGGNKTKEAIMKLREPKNIVHNGKTVIEWLEYNKKQVADLSGADLSCADLSCANLRGANLSGAQGLRDAAKWMKENFLHNELGYIVYKAIGNTSYSAPSYWKLGVIGEWLEEVVNPNRQDDCGCGVNIGTLEWVRNNYPNARYFELLVPWEDAAGIVVPYNTTGKARCARALQVREVT
jgi:hypothetical protein